MITREDVIENLISQLKDESKQIVDNMIADTGFRFELEKRKERLYLGKLQVRLLSDNHLGFNKVMEQESFYYTDLQDTDTLLNLFRCFDDRIRWYIVKNHSVSVKQVRIVGEVVRIDIQIGELK